MAKSLTSSRNVRAERAVALVKRMLQLNTPRGNKELQDLVQAINARTSRVPGAGSAYKRLLGRKPLLNLPCLPTQLSDEQKEEMARRMSAQLDRFRQKSRNSHLEKFKIGENLKLGKTLNLRTLVGKAE